MSYSDEIIKQYAGDLIAYAKEPPTIFSANECTQLAEMLQQLMNDNKRLKDLLKQASEIVQEHADEYSHVPSYKLVFMIKEALEEQLINE